MKKTIATYPRKLVLHREAIANLEHDQLRLVVTAAPPDDGTGSVCKSEHVGCRPPA
jgi:hypothetical protein